MRELPARQVSAARLANSNRFRILVDLDEENSAPDNHGKGKPRKKAEKMADMDAATSARRPREKKVSKKLTRSLVCY